MQLIKVKSLFSYWKTKRKLHHLSKYYDTTIHPKKKPKIISYRKMSSYPSEWPRQVLSIWQVPFRVIDLAYRDISAVGCRECCLLPRLYNDEGKLCYTWVLCIKLSLKPLRFYLWHQLIVGLFASFHTLPSNPANFLSKFRCIFGRAHVDEEVTKCGNLDVDITNDLKWKRVQKLSINNKSHTTNPEDSCIYPI